MRSFWNLRFGESQMKECLIPKLLEEDTRDMGGEAAKRLYKATAHVGISLLFPLNVRVHIRREKLERSVGFA